MSGQRRQPPKIARPDPISRGTSPAITALRERLARGATAADRARIGADFMAASGPFPLVEPGGDSSTALYTFVWRGDEATAAVLAFINRITDERRLADSLMESLGDCGLWCVTYSLSRTWRASYGFVPIARGTAPWWEADDQIRVRAALDRALPDPTNERVQRNRRGNLLSVAQGDLAPAEPFLAHRAGVAAGRVTAVDLPGGGSGWWYEPAAGRDRGAAGEAAGQALLIALDGRSWLTSQHLPTILDNMIAVGVIAPLSALLVDSGTRDERWRGLGEPEAAADLIAERIVPWARARAPHLAPGPESVVVAGQSLGGLVALLAAQRHPDTVGGAIAQSASLWLRDVAVGEPGTEGGSADGGAGGAAAVVRGDAEYAAPRARQRIYLEVGGHEWVLRDAHRDLAGRLAAAGSLARFREYCGGHDDACWRSGMSEGLLALLGARPPVNAAEIDTERRTWNAAEIDTAR